MSKISTSRQDRERGQKNTAAIKKLKKSGKKGRQRAERLQRCTDREPCGLDECVACAPLANHGKDPMISGSSELQGACPSVAADANCEVVPFEVDERLAVPDTAKVFVTLARASLVEGVAKLRETAGYIAAALARGATQSQVGKALGMSQSWVCQMLKWDEQGCVGSPFAIQSKQKRLKQKQNQAPNNPSVLKAEENEPVECQGTSEAPAATAGVEIRRAKPSIYSATDASADDGMAIPASLIQLLPEEQLLADDLILRLQTATEKVRHYVLDRVHLHSTCASALQ
jgi:hypothetical protein